MAFPLPVVQTLGEEYAYLDQWYGLNRWSLVRREMLYWQGRAIDLVEVVVQPKMHGAKAERFKIPFDATKFRPLAPAGAPSMPESRPDSWTTPLILLLLGIGVVYWLQSRK